MLPMTEDNERVHPNTGGLYCKNCGIPEEQFSEDELDRRWADGESQREVNERLRNRGRLLYCSIGCMVEKLGLY